ncbi:MAG: ABC transporter permease [Pseudomonadales bacterium]|nr:ABC transporter permease [Pseudomonadales bacterium]
MTALSMAGGYMLFVFSMSLLEGSWSNVVDIFTLDHTGHIQVHKDDYAKRPKIHKTIENPAVVETTLKNHEDVTGWAPRVYSSALAYGGNKTSIARIFGIDPELEPTVTRILQKVSAGQYFSAQPNADGYFPAMIGRGLANSLRLDVGDEIVLISSGADGSIANDIFIITAIIGNTTSFDRLGVFLPLTVAQEFLSIGGEVHEFALLARNKHDNEQLAVELQSLMPSLNVSPWQQIEATFYRTMQSDKQGNYFTMALIVFIVFIGVLNTVLMSVLERTKEFGVLKSIGCRPSELVKLIFIETVMLASISISVGLALILPVIVWFTEVGIKLDISVDMGGVVFDTMKGDLSAYVVFMPMGFMLLTAALISLPPGLRAARILPRVALGSH